VGRNDMLKTFQVCSSSKPNGRAPSRHPPVLNGSPV
jgi:hypothetical protein